MLGLYTGGCESFKTLCHSRASRSHAAIISYVRFPLVVPPLRLSTDSQALLPRFDGSAGLPVACGPVGLLWVPSRSIYWSGLA